MKEHSNDDTSHGVTNQSRSTRAYRTFRAFEDFIRAGSRLQRATPSARFLAAPQASSAKSASLSRLLQGAFISDRRVSPFDVIGETDISSARSKFQTWIEQLRAAPASKAHALAQVARAGEIGSMISPDGSLGISGVSRSPIEAVAGGGSRGKVGPVFATEVWNESESGRIGKIAGVLTQGIAGARIAEISDAQILRRFGGVDSLVGTAPTLQAGIVIRDALTKQHALDPLSRQHRGNLNPEFSIAPSAIAESRAEVHRAEFIQPVRADSAKAQSARSGAVTINSSPTVVINALEGRGDIEREVIDALRKHRETLFDELKQEAARRERPDY